MDIQIDFNKRLDRIREAMGIAGIDLLVATRGKSVTYIGGAFIPPGVARSSSPGTATWAQHPHDERVKDEAEVKLPRQAAAIADAAQERVREILDVGLTEMEIAGVGEMEMRPLGSEFH